MRKIWGKMCVGAERARASEKQETTHFPDLQMNIGKNNQNKDI